MTKRISRFARDEGGATAIEYGLIAALISLAAVIAFTNLGLSLVDIFTTLSTAMDSGSAGSS
ncbi:MAG: Flp family type IVb pilin [Pseudomonadota bacterium]